MSRIVRNTRSKPAATAALAVSARRQLLFDPLEDEHVRVHTHADGEDQPRDARQGQRGAGVRHEPEQQQEVRHDRDEGVDPGPVVVEEHEGGDQGEPGKRRHHAGLDRRGSE